MRRALTLFALLALPAHAGAAAFTSKASGNWNAAGQTTWNEVGTPGGGDTVTVQSPHTVTVSASATAGTSPADSTTAALTVANGGTLTVSAPLTVKGNLFANGTLAVSAGAGIEFDSSGDGAGTHTSYVLQTTYGSVLHVNGIAGTRSYVRSNAAGGNARLTSGGNLFDLVLSYADFTRLGSATAAGLAFSAATGDAGPGATRVLVTGCVFDTTGGFYLADAQAGFRVEFADNTWKNSYGNTTLGGSGNAFPLCAVLAPAAVTTGTRLFTGNSLDLVGWFVVPTGFTITGNYFGLSYYLTHSASGGWAAFSNNLVRQADGSNTYVATIAGDFTDNYLIADASAVDNWHSIQLLQADWTSDLSVLRNVWDGPLVTNPSDGGEMILCGDPASAHSLTVAFNLVLPSTLNASGGSHPAAPGALVTVAWDHATSSNATWTIEHNTVFADATANAASFHYGETLNTPRAGEVANYRSNIVWSNAGAGGFHAADRSGTFAVNDVIAAGHATNNGGYNLGAGHGGNPAGYDYPATTTPGTGDVTGNPAFVDPTRNLATWAVTRGSVSGTTAGKVADGLAYLAAAPGLTQSSLLPYVRGGFRPTNTALNGATYGGDAATTDAAGNPLTGTIGALAWQSGFAPRRLPPSSRGRAVIGLRSPAAARPRKAG